VKHSQTYSMPKTLACLCHHICGVKQKALQSDNDSCSWSGLRPCYINKTPPDSKPDLLQESGQGLQAFCATYAAYTYLSCGPGLLPSQGVWGVQAHHPLPGSRVCHRQHPGATASHVHALHTIGCWLVATADRLICHLYAINVEITTSQNMEGLVDRQA